MEIFDWLLFPITTGNKTLTSGTITFYEPTSTTPKAVYTDKAGSTPAANPLTLDGTNANATVFGSGYYRVVIKDSDGTTVYDIDYVSPSRFTTAYEEGTFTPVVVGASTAGTGTYTTQTGRYTRIGNRVFFDIHLVWTAHSGTGNIFLSGLPFTSDANAVGAVTIGQVESLVLSATYYLTGYVIPNSDDIALKKCNTGTSTAADVTFAAAGAAGTIRCSGHYEV